MHIVRELYQTDAEAGLLTLADDSGRLRRYVRRDCNIQLPEIPDLVQEGRKFLSAHGTNLNTADLPDYLTVGVRDGQPAVHEGVVSGIAEFVSAHEYRADERAFLIWEKFRDRGLENLSLNVLEIKQLLDNADPQPVRPWTVEEVEAELQNWVKDKGGL